MATTQPVIENVKFLEEQRAAGRLEVWISELPHPDKATRTAAHTGSPILHIVRPRVLLYEGHPVRVVQ